MSFVKKVPAEHIAQRIRDLRILKNISQAQLSIRAGLHRTYVSKIENGTRTNVSLDTLMRLAKELDCDVAQLVNPEYVEDVSPTKQLETLRELWHTMAEEFDCPVILVNRSGYIMETNRRFLTYTGYRKDEIPFLNILYWLPTVDVPRKGEIRARIMGRNGRQFDALVSFRVLKTSTVQELIICKIVPQQDTLPN